jgi:multidrug efflux pump subunit AcrA (membrane-fusion protein)
MNKQLLVVAIGVALMASSCKSEKEKAVTTVYTVTTPEVTNTSIQKDYVANIKSEKNIEIRAQKGGILQDIYVDEGQTVKAGQPLFRIVSVGTQEQIDKSKADVMQANIDLQNTSKLVSNKDCIKKRTKDGGSESSALQWLTIVWRA